MVKCLCASMLLAVGSGVPPAMAYDSINGVNYDMSVDADVSSIDDSFSGFDMTYERFLYCPDSYLSGYEGGEFYLGWSSNYGRSLTSDAPIQFNIMIDVLIGVSDYYLYFEPRDNQLDVTVDFSSDYSAQCFSFYTLSYVFGAYYVNYFEVYWASQDDGAVILLWTNNGAEGTFGSLITIPLCITFTLDKMLEINSGLDMILPDLDGRFISDYAPRIPDPTPTSSHDNLWNIIRDFFVRYCFGGTDSDGLVYNGVSFGRSMSSSGTIIDGSTADVGLPIDISNVDGDVATYIPVGDWLSTTFTILTFALVAGLVFVLLRWLFFGVANLMTGALR